MDEYKPVRMEEKEDIKECLRLFDEAGLEYEKTPVVYILRNMDTLGKNIGMAFEMEEHAKEKAAVLPECAGKAHALHAVDGAREGILAAQGHFRQAESMIEKGMKDAIPRHRKGNSRALEKPFSVIAVENELKSVMDCLAAAFIPTDLGIGRAEEAEGIRRECGRYLDAASGGLYKERADGQGLSGVLRAMRSLENIIQHAYGIAHETASRVAGLRPKAKVIVKRGHVMAEGYYWEREKEEREWAKVTGKEHMEDNSPAAENKNPYEGEKKKSLRKRLGDAVAESRGVYPHMQGKESRGGGIPR